MTDAMATLASLLQLLNHQERYAFLVEEVVQPTFTQPKSHITFLLDTPISPWYDSIYAYLHDNIMPSNLFWNQKQNFIQQTLHYTLVAKTLHRKGLDGTLFKCLEIDESKGSL